MSGYIGTQPVPQATQTRDSFTATSGQTSFATGGYTPNYLDVYLNGVKLASADYTATNGSDVVLASGAATGDILEVVAFTTFTPASIPDGTPSIDDNGDATAITIDSSENVLIGKAVTDLDIAGNALFNTGQAYHTRSGGTALYLNRLSSDGTIVDLRKDGTTVGSVGAHSSGTYLGTADTGIYFNGGNDSIDPYNPSVPINRDNAISLGAGSRRFKDLYLSGGVYLGGTGSANKLADYEEGTWTPAFVSGTFSYGIRTGWYTKVGDLVTCGFLIIWSSKSGSGTINITLPFTTSSGTHYRYAGSTGYMSGVDIGSSYKDFTFTTTPSTANVALVLNGDNIAGAGAQVADMSGSGEIQGSLSFKV